MAISPRKTVISPHEIVVLASVLSNYYSTNTMTATTNDSVVSARLAKLASAAVAQRCGVSREDCERRGTSLTVIQLL